MIYPRIAAVICVLLLIASLSLLCIRATTLTGPSSTYGSRVQHVDGEIVAIGPDMDFVLETADQRYMHFECGGLCQASLAHMQRHLREHAKTDVYYLVQGPENLLALSVD
jgi:hypothetical protein